MLKLVIGTKAYSSWSLRPWILLREHGIAFEEDYVPLDTPEFRRRVNAYGAGSTVPILVDGDTVVWESAAIMDYVADRFPERRIWPEALPARALARAMAAEMHAGFRPLRVACPMNLRRRFAHKDRGELVARDIGRIVHLWRTARGRHGGAGPFLFGGYTAADAMYAPVVTRLHSYSIPVDDDVRAYMDAVLGTPAFRAWYDAAVADPQIVAHDEVDEPSIGPFLP